MAYEVSTPVYQGPFDLLLHLILKEEVELWEVSLVQVVDAFLAEVERIDRLDLDVATEFLLIASTLVELKARRLLPGADMSELDEELLRFEERDLLLGRLLECKTFKDAARVLESKLTRGARSVPRTAGPEEPFRSLAPDPLERVTLKALQAAAERGLAPKADPVVDTYHVAPIRASVREAAEAVLLVLRDQPMSFRALVVGIDDKIEIIVRFLAVLELFKQGVVDLAQTETFGDLVVRRLTDGERALEDIDLEEWDEAPMPSRASTTPEAVTDDDVAVIGETPSPASVG
jgi:segregation and condensation protein A